MLRRPLMAANGEWRVGDGDGDGLNVGPRRRSGIWARRGWRAISARGGQWQMVVWGRLQMSLAF